MELGFYAYIPMHLHLCCLYYKLCQHRGLELEERQEGCWGQSWIFWEPSVLIHPLGVFRAQASYTELQLHHLQGGGRFQMLLILNP